MKVKLTLLVLLFSCLFFTSDYTYSQNMEQCQELVLPCVKGTGIEVYCVNAGGNGACVCGTVVKVCTNTKPKA